MAPSKSKKKPAAKSKTIKVTAATAPKLAHNKPKLTVTSSPSRRPADGRLNLPGPDWDSWGSNMRNYAHTNPAALIVGAIAVLMALLLVL